MMRSAPVRFEQDRSASLRSAAVKFVCGRFAPRKIVPRKFALEKSLPTNRAGEVQDDLPAGYLTGAVGDNRALVCHVDLRLRDPAPLGQVLAGEVDLAEVAAYVGIVALWLCQGHGQK